MKKIVLLMLISAFGITSFAQYKKASFFQRGRKTIGLTAGVKLFSKDLKPAPNFCLTYGNDKGKNRIFHWWDLDFTLSHKYSYTVNAYNPPGGKVTVGGKAGSTVTIAYNWGFYLLDNKKEENKVLPFIKLGIGVLLVTARETAKPSYTPASLSPDQNGIIDKEFSGDIGGGVLYKISDRLGMQANAGFRGYVRESINNGSTRYLLHVKHPFLNVGVRFLLKPKED
jgi:hypothetical protein